MTSKEMKGYLLRYFRFKRNMIAGTEVNVWANFYADVLSMSFDKNRSIEIEIKTTIQDLKNDFNKTYFDRDNGVTIYKHDENRFAEQYHPNYFYFAFPYDLEIPADLIPAKYGIMRINPEDDKPITVEKNASRLNNNNNLILYHSLLLRMGSELVTMYDKYVLGSQEIPDWLEKNNDRIQD